MKGIKRPGRDIDDLVQHATSSSVLSAEGAAVRILSACLFVSLMVSPASAASLSPSATPEIISGVQSCLAAVQSDGVDVEKLKQDGWSAVSASDGGKPVAVPVPMFSKGSLLLIHQATASTPICAIMTNVPDVPAISGIADELDSALNTDRKIENGKAIPAYWFPKGHVVQLATTGSEKAPGVRIVVGYRK